MVSRLALHMALIKLMRAAKFATLLALGSNRVLSLLTLVLKSLGSPVLRETALGTVPPSQVIFYFTFVGGVFQMQAKI